MEPHVEAAVKAIIGAWWGTEEPVMHPDDIRSAIRVLSLLNAGIEGWIDRTGRR